MSVRKKKIKQGYTVYKIPTEDVIKLRKVDCFGNLCDSCNETIEEIYYIPVLNLGMCKSCFNDWTQRAIFYQEDMSFEKDNIKWFENLCAKLDILIINAIETESNGIILAKSLGGKEFKFRP